MNEIINIIESDIVFKQYLKPFDYKLLDWQISLRIIASKIAFRKWLDYNY